jgi:hypothetical protein
MFSRSVASRFGTVPTAKRSPPIQLMDARMSRSAPTKLIRVGGADRTRKRLSRSSVRDATRCELRRVDITSDRRPASGSPDSIRLSRGECPPEGLVARYKLTPCKRALRVVEAPRVGGDDEANVRVQCAVLPTVQPANACALDHHGAPGGAPEPRSSGRACLAAATRPGARSLLGSTSTVGDDGVEAA